MKKHLRLGFSFVLAIAPMIQTSIVYHSISGFLNERYVSSSAVCGAKWPIGIVTAETHGYTDLKERPVGMTSQRGTASVNAGVRINRHKASSDHTFYSRHPPPKSPVEGRENGEAFSFSNTTSGDFVTLSRGVFLGQEKFFGENLRRLRRAKTLHKNKPS
jgi:hypothetical protein